MERIGNAPFQPETTFRNQKEHVIEDWPPVMAFVDVDVDVDVHGDRQKSC
jgi:hypothetical protein